MSDVEKPLCDMCFQPLNYSIGEGAYTGTQRFCNKCSARIRDAVLWAKNMRPAQHIRQEP